jgi:trigger factor
MSKVVRHDIDNLTAVLEVRIEPADYAHPLDKELDTYRKKAQIKGFRAGKAPAGLIRKMFGRSLLAEMINNLVQDTLRDYIVRENLPILGQPMGNAEQQDLNLDPNEAHDYVFRFDIGLAPTFDLQGLGSDQVFEQFLVEMPDERVEKEVEQLRASHTKPVSVEGTLEGKDLLTFSIREADEAGNPIEGGFESEILQVIFEDATEGMQQAVQGLVPGNTFAHDIYDVEKDRDRSFVRKHLLGLETDDERELGPIFVFTYQGATRQVPAEFDQEAFDAIFGPDQVHDESEMRAFIRNFLARQYDGECEALLFLDFQKRLMDANPLPLPDAFLRRWILESNENANAQLVEEEYPKFAKNLQWNLIRGKLQSQFGLSVSEEEVVAAFKDKARSYLGGGGYQLGEEFMDKMASYLMREQKDVDKMYNDLLADKLHVAIKESVQIKRIPIPEEDFKKKMAEIRGSTDLEGYDEEE